MTGQDPALSGSRPSEEGHKAIASPPEMAGSTSWRDYFEVVDGADKARKKCRLCGIVLDSRAGRAQKHLQSVHGEAPVHAPVNKDRDPDYQKPSKFPRGSREWGIEWLREIIDAPATTPDARLKALAEIREWESYEGSGSFDDQAELEKHLEQWDRVVKRAKELRELSKKLLRDATTRQDLMRQMTEIGG